MSAEKGRPEPLTSPLRGSERSEFGGLQMKSLARFCERTLWRGADAVLPVTEVLAADVRRSRGRPGGVHVIANGANLERLLDTARDGRVWVEPDGQDVDEDSG